MVLLTEVLDQLFKLVAGDLEVERQRPLVAHRDRLDQHVRFLGFGKLDLGFFGGVAQAQHGDGVGVQVDAGLAFEVVDQVVHDALVEVVATQVGVAVDRKHAEHAGNDFDDGDVESAAAEIVDEDGLVLGFFEAVAHGRGGR